jgi:site-specific DNA-methyltransferase (adenine-specific)
VKPVLPGYTLSVTDCVAAMRRMRPGSVDLVVTSPPYNLGIAYGKYEDKRSRQDYLNWTHSWAGEVKRLLKGQGSFFLNLGASPSNPLAPYEVVLTLTEGLGLVLQNTFHWIKSITLETREGKQVSAGHFKPIHSQRFVNDCHEYVFHLTKTGKTPLHRLNLGVPYSDKSNIGRWNHTGGKDLRCRGNNWFIPYETILNRDKDRPHPATFPVALAENCIKIHGCGKNSVVLDPFVGIGHSALAARNCGIRKFIGLDLDPHYIASAKKLLSSSTKK